MKKRQCRYLSITNGDNVYGSDVVANVLNYPPNPITRKSPDMLLAPLDSRNFAEHGISFYLYTYIFIHFSSSFLINLYFVYIDM